jgi:undecaprenyl-diphosphatase
MKILEVIFLAIIQGITEFLPVSSSAHLIIMRSFYNMGTLLDSKMLFALDIALHFGTLLAILTYFFKDLFKIAYDFLFKREFKLVTLLVIGTVPAVIVGLLFSSVIDRYFRNNLFLIGIFLIVIGYLLYYFDSTSENNKELKDISYIDAIVIGIAQMFALFPGFSRSGMTILSARYLGIKRVAAAKFSFYLSIPVMMGATLLTVLDDNFNSILNTNLDLILIGVFFSFLTGVIVIHFLLDYIKKNSYKIFFYYRLVLGSILLIRLLF